jgi:DNA-binding NtrC family response regulator
MARILIIDEYRDAAEAIARLLRLAKHEVRICTKMSEAEEAAKAYQPDLIIVEFYLGRVAQADVPYGLAVGHRIMATHRCKGIVLSTQTQAQALAQSAQLGFSRHLPKPCDYRQLIEAVEEALREDALSN